MSKHNNLPLWLLFGNKSYRGIEPGKVGGVESFVGIGSERSYTTEVSERPGENVEVGGIKRRPQGAPENGKGRRDIITGLIEIDKSADSGVCVDFSSERIESCRRLFL